MTALNIDLGEKPADLKEMMPTPEKGKVFYPRLHITSDEKLDLPESGHMMIEFEKTGSAKETRGDKTVYSCTLEVKKIIGVHKPKEMEAPAKNPAKDSEDALDSLMKKRMKEKNSEHDEEDDSY